ncbi:hypothetical protein SBRY_30152 [Actinacidiphila bryophytorum]|uniref:Uncharacterized protein n=1 Tax=Actinacidiphila bryophytorum TaxID=1436133 RepID=A0A9W4H0G8_9ACTN|nr:hypothetical protein SBRY_30152 [Actinacidiphila bryophytorum]
MKFRLVGAVWLRPGILVIVRRISGGAGRLWAVILRDGR